MHLKAIDQASSCLVRKSRPASSHAVQQAVEERFASSISERRFEVQQRAVALVAPVLRRRAYASRGACGFKCSTWSAVSFGIVPDITRAATSDNTGAGDSPYNLIMETLPPRLDVKSRGRSNKHINVAFHSLFFLIYSMVLLAAYAAPIETYRSNPTAWFHTPAFWVGSAHTHLNSAMKRYYVPQIGYWVQQWAALFPLDWGVQFDVSGSMMHASLAVTVRTRFKHRAAGAVCRTCV
ncbi:hypothetical protein C8F04DRAFT_1200679 [Mycena alexandri]|uniref:Uncharacterized protein n=1 Tax=Mycena alexandri TaxID=1745969 RepID=A0AAD6RZ84_9AGAR|nr:hypothetical protein C8F04DRAFT_1200679 [Mycena alexandri]